MAELPSSASVIIVGGGILGVSTAYHLAKAGMDDVVLLERRQLACGTTWHSVGSVGQVRGTEFLTDLSTYTAGMLREVEEETGLQTGYKKVGSIMVALNEERHMEMKRTVASAKLYGLDAAMLTREEVAERAPYLKVDDVLAGMYLPDDGATNPVDTVNALAKAARDRGVAILEGVEVVDFLKSSAAVAGVATDRGEIAASKVVLCTGIWSRDLAEKAGVLIPLVAAEHFYAVTEPIAAIDPKMPMIRVPDERTYYKHDAGKLLFGCFEEAAKPWGLDGIPEDFCFDSLPEDIDHFEPILRQACVRMPMLNEAGIQLFFNGPEAFTPDGEFHIGEAPELKGLFTVAGMNSVGVMTSGGVGRLLSRILLKETGKPDLSTNDVARTQIFETNKNYLRERAVESVGVLYGLQQPGRQLSRGRGIRRSPVHDVLLASGACMEADAGWERPAVFAPRSAEPRLIESYLEPNWLAWALEECAALRDGEALIDTTASAKFEVPVTDETAAFFAALAPVGGEASSGLRAVHSESGDIEQVVSVFRLDADRALVVAPARDQRVLERLLRERLSGVRAFDATSAYAIFDLAGISPWPGTAGRRTDDAEGMLPTRMVDVGMTRTRVATFADLGCRFQRLIVSTEYGASVWQGLKDEIPRASNVGNRALAFHAAVRGCPRWHRDYGPGDGLAQTVPDGEGASLRRLIIEAVPYPLWGGEPVLADGQAIGRVTSAGPDPSTGAWGALVRLRPHATVEGKDLTVLLGGDSLKVRTVAS